MNKISLYDRFFQFGYVARDAEVAMAQFNDSFGPVEWVILRATPEYPQMTRVAFAFRGGVNIEVIEATDVPSLYRDFLPVADQTMRLHHLGFIVDDYPATVERLKVEGYDIPFSLSDSDFTNFAYADARAKVGHYLEYVKMMPAGQKFWESIPGYSGLP